ncbi:Hypothetical predicted protein, partial [Podarcis lilfordi]
APTVEVLWMPQYPGPCEDSTCDLKKAGNVMRQKNNARVNLPNLVTFIYVLAKTGENGSLTTSKGHQIGEGRNSIQITRKTAMGSPYTEMEMATIFFAVLVFLLCTAFGICGENISWFNDTGQKSRASSEEPLYV